MSAESYDFDREDDEVAVCPSCGGWLAEHEHWVCADCRNVDDEAGEEEAET